MTHHSYGIVALISAIGAMMLQYQPYLSGLATIIAIVAGCLSIYKSIKKK